MSESNRFRTHIVVVDSQEAPGVNLRRFLSGEKNRARLANTKRVREEGFERRERHQLVTGNLPPLQPKPPEPVRCLKPKEDVGCGRPGAARQAATA